MKQVHLVVLIHGMWGNPDHVATIGEIIKEAATEHDATVDVLAAQTNREVHTYDGIDWGGERVADEIQERKRFIEETTEGAVTRFSVIGYSLGGLVARYVVGILYARDFFKTVAAVNFATFATPHLGLVRTPGWLWAVSSRIGPTFLSRTGKQFYSKDKWSSSGSSLLAVMADKSFVFYKALSEFQNIRIYGNAVKDRTVSYVTALMETEDPFTDYMDSGLQIEYDKQYEPLVTSWKLPAERPPTKEKPAVLSKAWFKSFSFPLPPFLVKPFPINVLIYMSLPFLIPIFLTMMLVRFSVASRGSQQRIKLLESSSDATKLANLLREVEYNVGGALADLVDEPGPPDAADAPQTSHGGPILRADQRAMARALSAIPQLSKHVAFIPHFINSHAVIVCRDPRNFPAHNLGKKVIRHLADHFIFE